MYFLKPKITLFQSIKITYKTLSFILKKILYKNKS